MLDASISYWHWPATWAALLSTLLVTFLLVVTKHHHGHLTLDSTIGVQKFHVEPTPRVGGVGIYIGVLLAWAMVSHKPVKDMLGTILLASIPALAFGLLEDITKRVGVLPRLLATMVGGVVAWLLTGIAVNRLDVQGLDWIMAFTPVAVLFTAFAISGLVNAINIIDGFNGLASGASIIMLSGLAAISFTAGDTELASACFVFGGAILGFGLLNWPFGKIFLGDGGAYFVGFGIAWLSVLLLTRNANVSAWSLLLVGAYPVVEVLFSIVRRQRRRLSPGSPDRLHLHSLVKRRVVPRLLPDATDLIKNSTTGTIMWLAALVPVVIACAWPHNTAVLAAAFAICTFLYSAVYARLTQFCWCWRAATLSMKRRSLETPVFGQ